MMSVAVQTSRASLPPIPGHLCYFENCACSVFASDLVDAQMEVSGRRSNVPD